MFQKGNRFGMGRPKISLTKPELLMPAIFSKGNVNWAGDFIRLYKVMRERPLDDKERACLKFFVEFMPYLCTKVQLKEIMGSQAMSTPADSAANAERTSKLLKALEAEQRGPSAQA